MLDTNTVEFYSNNANSYCAASTLMDTSSIREHFLSYISEENPVLLDAGCGSGRDSKEFMNIGAEVVAFDACKEMVEFAQNHTGLNVLNICFSQLKMSNCFDGIWAMASMVHMPPPHMSAALRKLKESLKDDGAIMVSVKFGSGAFRDAFNRLFFRYDQEAISAAAERAGLKVIDIGIAKNPNGEDFINTIMIKD